MAHPAPFDPVIYLRHAFCMTAPFRESRVKIRLFGAVVRMFPIRHEFVTSEIARAVFSRPDGTVFFGTFQR